MARMIVTGGPAFPRPASENRTNGNEHVPGFQGMTLRDYFAGLALPAVMRSVKDKTNATDWAHLAYLIADAMIYERTKED